MDYLVEEYKRKQSQSKLEKNNVERYKRKRAIQLFDDGLQDVGVIAEALETTQSRVKEYLGKTRLAMIEASKKDEKFEVPKKPSRVRSPKADSSKNRSSKPKKFNERYAQRYSDERDEAIVMFAREGISLNEVVNKLKGLGFTLTLNQVKERYMALGLPLYSKQELEEIRKEKAKAKARETKRESKKRKMGKEKKETKTDEQPKQEYEAKSFVDVRNMMYRAIKARKSQIAMNIGRYYLNCGDFLGESEKKKLKEMVDIIEMMRKKDRKERKERKDKKDRDR